MDYPKISVIVPVYNVAQYIKKCINSILSQSYPNIELIIIDDGSTDGSAAIIDQYACDARVVVIHKENSGQSDCRNIAFHKSTGDYLYFIDSDDYVMPEALIRMYQSIIKEDSDFCCCRFKLVDENGEVLKESPLFSKGYIEGNEYIFSNAICAEEIKSTLWTKMIKKDFLMKNGIEPERKVKLHDDCMLTFLCAVYANRVSFVNDVLYCALQRPNSISRRCNPLMVTVYDTIYSILKEHLEKEDKFCLYSRLFYQGYGKSMLYALLLATNRSTSYPSYKTIYESIDANSFFYCDSFVKAIRHSAFYSVLYRISQYPKLYYSVGKILKHKFNH